MQQVVEAKGMTMVFSDGQLVNCEQRQPEDTGIGYMEFFDWLAGCDNAELTVLAQDLPEEDRLIALGAISFNIREAAGLAIWRNM